MEVTPELRRLIHRGAPAHEIRDKIRKQGRTARCAKKASSSRWTARARWKKC